MHIKLALILTCIYPATILSCEPKITPVKSLEEILAATKNFLPATTYQTYHLEVERLRKQEALINQLVLLQEAQTKPAK